MSEKDKKIDFSEIQTLANILNKFHSTIQITATLTLFEHFTRDEVQDIDSLYREDFTIAEIATIYGTDNQKVKRVITYIERRKEKKK